MTGIPGKVSTMPVCFEVVPGNPANTPPKLLLQFFREQCVFCQGRRAEVPARLVFHESVARLNHRHRGQRCPFHFPIAQPSLPLFPIPGLQGFSNEFPAHSSIHPDRALALSLAHPERTLI